MRIIDPHLHFFALAQGQYDWLRPQNPPFLDDKHLICKDFGQKDLALAPPFELAGFVHIEAGFDNEAPWREIAWLEAKAQAQHITKPFRSVGGVDLTQSSAQFNATLDKLKAYSSLVGVRHILDDQAPALLQNKQVQINLQSVAKAGLIFEAQWMIEDQTASTLFTHLAQDIGLKCAINHAGMVPLPLNKNWQRAIAQLAAVDNLVIKASGWEMSNRAYPIRTVENIISILLKHFGENRVILASNFPLCLWRSPYHSLWQQYFELTLTPMQQQALSYENAHRFYQFA